MAASHAVRFLVSCRHCHRPVMTIAWTAAEVRELERHARACAPDALGEAPGVEETLGHFRVVVVQRD